MSKAKPIVTPVPKPSVIVIHPLVLLSVVDHYNRVVDKSKNRRVVGALLGDRRADGVVDISNCYAIPFEEDPKDPNIWFLDHIYNEKLNDMYQQININEKIVGWYTTGSRFKPNDIQINQIFYKYTSNPIFVVIDVHQQDPISLPTEAYISVDEVTKSGEIIQNFYHLPSTVQAIEPEEIGVEQLLREINSMQGHSLTNMVKQKMQALEGLVKKIQQIQKYLQCILSGKVQQNSNIINQLQVLDIINTYNIIKQEILNYLPNLVSEEIIQTFTVKNNDNMFGIYLATIVRSVIALHSLINNQISNKEQEKADKFQSKKDEAKKDETKKDDKLDEKKDLKKK